ncbi:formate dehydrogenase accessory sulfurtransferase FdhD [Reichenbachiella carrageenanivorans]|uniref:Sulfur carrier protein FdhD n=1 Tax=Reichenbachiella carrageenanivorans TaxID=2979869 RepID=A0ABY6CVP8_9BACT|nr:formate dehydrogenase accessory sulfurtransferase FdhD [Reichenbachiella carrageenanivorans]UXX77982.1 formate dehydrogenase accessory sulfurtransferase FdhD [Reichenbachiella carrageenanivorans]
MSTLGISTAKILKVNTKTTEVNDLIVREEPLEIRVGYGLGTQRKEFSLAVTMRTPGADEELARGFLLSEGIVKSNTDILAAKYCMQAKHPENTLKVELNTEILFDPKKFQRNFYATSSCGVCGKAVLEAISSELPTPSGTSPQIHQNMILNLNDQLKAHQNTFKYTGGLHAATLFDQEGKLLILREDIGRHNALDKLIGVCGMRQMDFSDKILWLSGRMGFEMVQKSAMIGIKTIVALGAPSSLAIELAQQQHITIIGFLKKDSFNIYSGKENVILETQQVKQ